jgi:hypothetical protein
MVRWRNQESRPRSLAAASDGQAVLGDVGEVMRVKDGRKAVAGSRGKRSWVPLALSLGMLVAHGLAWGDEAREPSDHVKLETPGRFTIGIGVYLTSFNSSIQLNSGSLRGTRIDLEKDLGLDASQSLLRVDARYRFDRRQDLVISYYDISRSADRTLLDHQIRFGDEVFNVNSRIDSFLDTQFISLAYRYAFASGRRADLGLSLGFSVVTLRTGIAASATVGPPGDEREADVGTDAKFVAPLPLVGLHGRWRVGRKWIVEGAFQYIKLTISDITGSDTDAYIRVEYYPLPRLGFGLGYASNRIDLNPIRRPKFRGEFLYEFGGLEFYAKYAL